MFRFASAVEHFRDTEIVYLLALFFFSVNRFGGAIKVMEHSVGQSIMDGWWRPLYHSRRDQPNGWSSNTLTNTERDKRRAEWKRFLTRNWPEPKSMTIIPFRTEYNNWFSTLMRNYCYFRNISVWNGLILLKSAADADAHHRGGGGRRRRKLS